MKILAEVNRPDFDIKKVDEMISRDVNLSFKLLKYMNSAYFKRMKEVSTIREALFLMGTNEVKKFVNLMAISQMNSSKPDAIIYTSAFRAKFCEQCSKLSSRQDNPEELFTLGIFSLIDAILDQSMETIMKQLPLMQDIKDALVEKKGDMAVYLNLTEAYETADWPAASQFSLLLGIDEKDLPSIYIDACSWSSEII
jgi:EAL and modified HD-GYP domain-containing signal transduction protein